MSHGCPICKLPLNGVSQHKPFCSSRCQMLDLHQWLTGSYAVPDEPLAQCAVNTLEAEYEDEQFSH
jgi:endogenous inhibitor of DNA gyrase (YacG/DUF329 family)